MVFGLPVPQDKRGILTKNFDNTFNTLYPAGNKPEGTGIGQAVYDAMVAGADFYVDPTKAVNGAGTVGDPYQPSQAMATAVGGIYVWETGIYTGVDPAQTGDGNRAMPSLLPLNSGTLENPITHIARNAAVYGTTNLTDLRSGATTSGLGWPAFGTNNQNYVNWYGFKSDGADADNKSYTDTGMAVTWSSIGSTIAYCDFDGDPSQPADNYSGVRSENSTDCRAMCNKFNDYNAQGVNHAAVIIYGDTGFELHNNEMTNCLSAVQVKANNIYDLKVFKNVITSCTNAFRFHGPLKGPSGELNLFYQNFVDSCTYIAEFTSSAPDTGEQNGLRIFNNVFYNIPGDDAGALKINFGYEVEGVIPRDNEFFNNIIHTAAHYWGKWGVGIDIPYLSDFMSCDRNVIFNITQLLNGNTAEPLDSATWADWQTAGQDVNGTQSDPLFVDIVNGNYTLQGGSPAENLGQDREGIFGPVDGVVHAGIYVTGNETIGVPA